MASIRRAGQIQNLRPKEGGGRVVISIKLRSGIACSITPSTVIEPTWNKVFIFDSRSSRINKGTHAAIRRLQDFGLKLSHNYTRTLWFLKLDVKNFFPVDASARLDFTNLSFANRKLSKSSSNGDYMVSPQAK